MKKLLSEHKGKVEVTRLPDALVEQFRTLPAQAIQQESERNPAAKTVAVSYARFQSLIGDWSKVWEGGDDSLLTT